MIEFFKFSVLPYAAWLLIMGACIVGIFKRAEVPALVYAALVSLPNIWYPAQQLPLGTKSMTLLFLSCLIGVAVNKTGFTPSPKRGLFFLSFFITYLAVWNTSLRFGLDLPLTGANPVLANWKNYAMMMALYFMVFNVFDDEKGIRKLTLVMFGAVLFLLLQNYRSVLAGENYSYDKRASGPFEVVGMNPNHFGAFLAHYMAAALGLFLVDNHKWRRLLYGMVFIGGVYPLFYTYSRGAYAALVLAVLVLGLVRFRPLLLVVLLLGLYWETMLPESVVERINMTETEDGELEESSALRLVVWNLARDLFSDNPIFGIGFQGFFFATDGMWLRNVHNLYLQIAAEQGVVGLSLLGLLLLRGLLSAWRLFRSKGTPFARGYGLAFMATTMAVTLSNVFGDRFTQLALGSFFFLMMGAVDRLLVLQEAPSPAASPLIDEPDGSPRERLPQGGDHHERPTYAQLGTQRRLDDRPG